MIPLRDNIPSRTTPVVNYLMIGACALVFLMQLRGGEQGSERLVIKYGMIPQRVFHPDKRIEIPVAAHEVRMTRGTHVETEYRPLPAPTFPPWWTLLTCIFLHGGWMHFLGNMWFLHIFGDNVEDRFGHFGYVLFYLGSGVAASLAHLLTNASSNMPTIGASGAIAGVMGAYLYLYPHGKVLALVPIFVFLQIFVVPAPIFLGIWFLLQFVQGTSSLGEAEGVAWWAHIGGFAAGFAVAWLLREAGRVSPPVETVLPNTERMTHYRYRRRPPPYDSFEQ